MTQPPAASLPEEGFIREAQLLNVLPVSSTTLWRMVRTGAFPQPVKISTRVTAWRVSDVRAWFASRKAAA